MKPSIPWSVKGVEPQAREAAKAAARRAGMTLGQWLNQVIRESGGALSEAEMAEIQGATLEPAMARSGEVRWEAHGGSGVPESRELSQVLARMENLESRQAEAIYELGSAIESLERKVRSPEGMGGGPDASRLEQRLSAIDAECRRRYDSLSRELTQISTRHNEALARHEREQIELSQSLSALSSDFASSVPADRGALASLRGRLDTFETRLEAVNRDSRSAAQTFERAVGTLADRLAASEARQREQAQSLERSLASLTDRVGAAMRRDGSGEAEAVRALESAVSEITRHFETVEERRQKTQRSLEESLSGLAQRLAEADRRHAAQMKQPLDALDRAIARNNERIAQAEDRTADALSQITDRLAQMGDRFERSDTEFKASRLALMRALDEATRRLDTLERRTEMRAEGWPEPRAEAKSEARPQPDPEAETTSFVSRLMEEQAHQPALVPPAEEAGTEEILPRKPVGRLLEEAREAARADRAQRTRGGEEEPTLRDMLLDAPAAGLREAPSEDDRRRARGRSVMRTIVVLLVALVALGAGLMVWDRSQNGLDPMTERPGVIQGAIDALRALTGKGPAPRPAEGARGEPAPMPSPEAAPAPSLPGTAPADPPIAPEDPLSAVPDAAAPGALVYMRADSAPETRDAEARRLAEEGVALAQRAQTASEAAAAAVLLGRAATMGDPEAQFALGRLYETGRGLTADREAARRWYEAAAAQGERNAAFNLGSLAAATGSQAGYRAAVHWFLKAAQRGHRDAQFNLAVLYARGLGVEASPLEAYAWFSVAAAAGDPEAAAERTRMAGALDAAARAEGDALALARRRGEG